MAKYKKLRAQRLKALRASRTYGIVVFGDSFTQKLADITVRVADQDGISSNVQWTLEVKNTPEVPKP